MMNSVNTFKYIFFEIVFTFHSEQELTVLDREGFQRVIRV